MVKIVLVITLLFLTGPLSSQDNNQSLRVLFLGNSVFYFNGGLYQSFMGFCFADGIDCKAVSQRHKPENTHGAEFLGIGRIPNNLPDFAAGEKYHTLIREGGYDYVIIEARREGHLLPEWIDRSRNIPGWIQRFVDYDVGESIPYEQNLAALARLYKSIVNSGAKMVLYMHPGLYYTPDWKSPLAQIHERFKDDLEAMEVHGRDKEVILVPASLLWRDALNRYDADNWYADHIHGNAMARYASGCMLFTFLTGKDPRNNSFRELPKNWQTTPDEPADLINEEDAEWIKKQVWFYYTTRRR
jgi:hypothetical protein